MKQLQPLQMRESSYQKKCWFKSTRLLLTIFVSVLMLQVTATVRRVRLGNPNSIQDGSSWQNAYSSLQAAINASSVNDEVWVAQPVIASSKYQPAVGSSFTLKDGVKIYGGFTGVETLLTQRDWRTNIVTIYSNGASVFTCNSVSTVLDGVTITGVSGNNGDGINSLSSHVQLSNVIISGIYGRGVYSAAGYVTLTNCVISNNTGGTGVYSIDNTNNDNGNDVNVSNCVFSNNAGRAIYCGSGNAPNVINCTFMNNSGGAITAITGVLRISNSIFWNNSGTVIVPPNVNGQVLASISTSYLQTAVTGASGSGNVISTVNPFVNNSDPDGADNRWMTADDGLQLTLCNGGPLIDKGTNNVSTLLFDLAGQPRKFDVTIIANGGSGTSPIVDMGAYENQNSTTAIQLSGSIGNGHVIPYKHELKNDYITSVANPITASAYRWEQSINGTTWAAATAISPTDSGGYRLPYFDKSFTSFPTTIYYRRVAKSATYCNIEYATDTVAIKIVQPNGRFHGRVISKNGNGIFGDTVVVKHYPATSLPGADIGYSYYGVTDVGGNYSVDSIFYGDPANGQSEDKFDIQVVKYRHNFDPPTAQYLLKQNDPQTTNIDIIFKDLTVLSVTGTTYQVCSNCNNLTTGNSESQTCPIDSIRISKGTKATDTAYYSYTGLINSNYGRYSIAAENPGPLLIVPTSPGHTFTPSFDSINVQNDIDNQDFQDITTHTISGYLTAGCGEAIGSAVLEFSDVLKDPNGNARVSCFTKRVTTSSVGYYSITLPARKYFVKVISYTPPAGIVPGNPAYIYETDLKAFFNDGSFVKKDSLTRDITRKDTTLNLVYERPPVMKIVMGLNDTMTCNGQPRGFVLMEQIKSDSFRIKVYQGAPTLINGNGCLVNDTSKVALITNVPSLDNSNLPTKYFRPVDTGVVIRFRGGTPNVAGNHLKSLNLQYADRYGRMAPQIFKNVLVTGARQDSGNNVFPLLTPEIPLLVLHDPPGDGSYSRWESSEASETAFRLYAAKGEGLDGWLEVKIGKKETYGIIVSTEAEVWATETASAGTTTTNTSSSEKIISTKYAQAIETSALPTEVGADGDVYVGLALNIIYSSAKEVRYKNCVISDTNTMIIANNGPNAEFHYSEKYIKEGIIPQLKYQASIQQNPLKRDSILNHAYDWQQMIDNNARNKTVATFDKAINFNGGGSTSTYSTTTTATASTTTEFKMEINAALATAAGFEIDGSGLNGGVNVTFKTETGNSNINTIIKETTIGYKLFDVNSGDGFALEVRKDKVYATPVFKLIAGQSSCPPEPGTQLRDQVDLSAPVPVAYDTNQVGTVQFKLKIANNSAIVTDSGRTFRIYLDGASNPDAAIVTINGNSTNQYSPLPLFVTRGTELPVTVRVSKDQTSQVYSYRDLKIVVVDACNGSITKSALLSALFPSPCSSVMLSDPTNGWKLGGTSYTLPLTAKNYTLANLTSIGIQYASASSGWIDFGTPVTPSNLNPNAANGTILSWNTQGLADGSYKVRLKLLCSPQREVYSETATGIIDHTPPALLGKPDPTDDNYINGDLIAFAYNEKINTANLNNGKVTMTRISNNTDLPVTVTGYENRIVIVPVNPITGYIGETIRVIVKNISDENGNEKAKNDTIFFLIGTTTVATGTNALTVSVSNPVVSKNSDSTINVLFKLPVSRAYATQVNYTISGTARLGVDYTIAYDTIQPSYVYNNGSRGAISIAKDSLATVLRIKPINDTALTPDKTVIISLNEGGDYALGAITSVMGTLTSEDGISTYTFIGDGNWNIKNNWLNGKMPLTTLVAPKEIIINPSGTCILNVAQTIRTGAQITVKENRRFVIQGNLKMQ